MASSGHFYPGQIYEGYKAVEVVDPACTQFLAKGKDFFQHFNPKCSKCHFCFVGKKPCHPPGPVASNVRGYLRSRKDEPFGKEFPVSGGPTPDATSGYSDSAGSRQRYVERSTNVGESIPVGGRPIYSSSAVPTPRINTEGVGKIIIRISNSLPDLDAEGIDELDFEEVEVVHNPVGHQSSTSPSQPPAKIFQSRLIPNIPKSFQPTLAAIPTSLPHSSPSSPHTRPAINTEVGPSPIQKSRASPIVTSHQLQPEASFIRRREELSPFPFPASQVFLGRDCWPI
ncbi:hypothetical protein O181_013079 [Austropuccinia psidii MF-1]|uniref:Uncharacterized protein n=1 Tax=Austropuccinia psidii MF-1 TaxID=1389203 RepID=A0A9Q3GNH3_9BASI|nr:hypothetical protein [Austropuccinia psidii MF-1]